VSLTRMPSRAINRSTSTGMPESIVSTARILIECGRRVIVLFAALMVTAIALPRIGEAAEGAVACKLRALVTDPDPNGTNIRAAPRADAPVIGHLPPRWHMAKDVVEGADFEMTASQDGWLQILNAEDDVKRVFDGPGWIWGGLVGVTLGGPVLRTAPRSDAPIAAQLSRPDKGWEPDSFQVSHVQACPGEFVQVRAKPPGGGAAVQGWLYRPCANQLTTRDLAGNEPPIPSVPEVWRDQAGTICLALPDGPDTVCSVEQFGRLGSVYVTTLYYAMYHCAHPRDRGLDYRREVILEDNGGRLHQCSPPRAIRPSNMTRRASSRLPTARCCKFRVMSLARAI
jgi:hypothetical protein